MATKHETPPHKTTFDQEEAMADNISKTSNWKHFERDQGTLEEKAINMSKADRGLQTRSRQFGSGVIGTGGAAKTALDLLAVNNGRG